MLADEQDAGQELESPDDAALSRAAFPRDGDELPLESAMRASVIPPMLENISSPVIDPIPFRTESCRSPIEISPARGQRTVDEEARSCERASLSKGRFQFCLRAAIRSELTVLREHDVSRTSLRYEGNEILFSRYDGTGIQRVSAYRGATTMHGTWGRDDRASGGECVSGDPVGGGDDDSVGGDMRYEFGTEPDLYRHEFRRKRLFEHDEVVRANIVWRHRSSLQTVPSSTWWVLSRKVPKRSVEVRLEFLGLPRRQESPISKVDSVEGNPMVEEPICLPGGRFRLRR